jgi:hypothetical protein
MPEFLPVSALPAAWRRRATELERFAPAAATAFLDAAIALESALRDEAGQVLTLAEASLRSGLSVDRLRHKIAAGEITNAGRKHAPRIRAADLPQRATRAPVGLYDPAADARALVAGGR